MCSFTSICLLFHWVSFSTPEFPIHMDFSDTIFVSNDESIPAGDEFMDIYSGLEGDCAESDCDEEQEGML